MLSWQAGPASVIQVAREKVVVLRFGAGMPPGGIETMPNTADSRSRTRLALIVSVGLVLGGTACNRSSSQPVTQAGYPSQGPSTAPVQQTSGYGDGTGQPPAVLAASPAAVAPVAAPVATLSQPNALALPCSTDAQCLTHRCNVPAGKCAWPCQTDTDCMPGNACIAPTCLPKLQ
jgi:hypothetical protein